MHITIIVPEISKRMTYVCDWIFVQQLGIAYELCTDHSVGDEALLTIDYRNTPGEFAIPNSGLLFEKGIVAQSINKGFWKDLPVLYPAQEGDYFLPFDIFSAVFYLISRYEEYLHFVPDKHQRYPATESILYRYGLLERPIIDEWLFAFANLLKTKGVSIQEKHFELLPTYDVDIAWTYKNKGLKRTLGGYFKSLLQSDVEAIQERTAVLVGKKQDPYFSFDSTNALHKNNGWKPLYFVLAAAKNGPFDKHILPLNKQMSALIKALAQQYPIGLHPSYNANAQEDLFAEERGILSAIAGQQITFSRQHYIKIEWPTSYRRLVEMGFQQDYSMGYGTHLGFRAGTSRAFLWYDLLAEQNTNLQIFPFCFMDTTAHYEMKLSTKEAFEKLSYFKNKLQKINGLMITVFHNFSLGTDKEWQGWAEAYADFLKK